MAEVLRGADPVNDEIEVGSNSPFESKWRIVAWSGRAAMLVFVLAGLAGLLGRGPFSHRTLHDAGAGLAVDFEPLAHTATPTQVTIHIDHAAESPTLDLFLGATALEPMGLHQILPQPAVQRAVEGGLRLTFAVAAETHDTALRFALQPTGIGAVTLVAQLAGHAPIHWTQYVLP